MKLTAKHNGENHEISLDREDERLFAQVDDRSYEISVQEVENGHSLLLREGGVYECLIEEDGTKHSTFTVHLRNRTYVTKVIDPRRLSSVNGTSVHAGGGSAKITSPMAGKVVRLLVEQGAQVKAGDGIVLVEAMKMQNELKTPRDGVVAEIRTVENAAVNAGDVLAIIDPHFR